jgi:hypothetical protein
MFKDLSRETYTQPSSSSSLYIVPGGRPLDKLPLPPIKKSGSADNGSVVSLESHDSFAARPRTGTKYNNLIALQGCQIFVGK